MSTKLLPQFSSSSIDESFNLAISDPHKLNHLFPAKHKFDPLVQQLGSQENVVRSVLNAANGNISITPNGIFHKLPVVVNGYTVYVNGRVL